MQRRTFIGLAVAGGAALALPLWWRRRPDGPAPSLSAPSWHAEPGRRFADRRGNLYDLYPRENRVEFRLPNGTLRAEANSGLRQPTALAFDETGRILVLEAQGARVRRFDRDARPLGTFASFGGEAGQLRSPRDLAVVGEEVVVADTFNHRLQRFDAEGRARGTIGQLGRDAGDLNAPMGVTLGPDRTLYVADAGNARIAVYSLDGRHLDSFGSRGREPGQLRIPRGLRFDPSGRLHVVDSVGGWVHIFDARHQFVDRYRPTGPDGQPATPSWISNRADGSILVGLPA